MEPREQIFWEIDKLRRENLADEIPNVWEKIISDQINDKNFKITVNKTDDYEILFENKKGGTGSFQKKSQSLCSKIFRLNAKEYNLNKKSDLRLENLKDYVKLLLNLDKKIQLNYCTNPIRQGSHQKIQIKMLDDELDKNKWKISHPKEGYLNIDGQKIVSKNEHSRGLSRDARSIDIVVKSKLLKEELIFYGFMKFSADKGSLQTEHQSGEATRWLSSAMEHVDTNNNKTYFFVISDGKEGERNLPKYQKQIQRFKDRIFAGNTQDIIDKIKSYE